MDPKLLNHVLPTQVGKARKIAQKYMLTYGEPIPTQQLVTPNP